MGYRIQNLKKSVLLSLIIVIAGCSPLKKLTVLVQMEPQQRFYFKNTVLQNFEKKTSVKVNVIDYNNADSIESYLKKNPGKINLVKIPYEEGCALMSKGYFKPLDSFLSLDDLRFFNDNYLLSSFGMVDGRPTMIPRQFETKILVYSRSKVIDAVKKFPEQKVNITTELKEYNGFGLPAHYTLESDPNKWDFYDLAVIGLIWRHSGYDGRQMGRIAFQSKRGGALSDRIADGIYQMRGDSSAYLKCKGDQVLDIIHWEALYTSTGIYNRKMWENGLSETDLMTEFANGGIFLGIMSQSDCFYLHGTGHDGNKGLLKDPQDLGIAVIPTACSVELDEKGEPLRKGTKTTATKSWWWGIPYNANSTNLTYRLAKFISDTVSQVGECSRYGMIPVRKEVVNEMPTLFKDTWIKDIFEAAFKQLVLNGTTNVINNSYSANIGKIYDDLWADVVVKHNWSSSVNGAPDRNYIRSLVESKYTTRAKQILSGSR